MNKLNLKGQRFERLLVSGSLTTRKAWRERSIALGFANSKIETKEENNGI